MHKWALAFLSQPPSKWYDDPGFDLQCTHRSLNHMIATNQDAWSETQTKETLAELRKDYPRYTDNELYAIWCHLNGRIPTDAEGKLDLEQWKIHATGDGEHYQEGGFRVSRALYGRAMKAEKGMPKPARVVRKRKSVDTPEANSTSDGAPPDISFAREYHRAATTIYSVLEKRKEISNLMRGLGRLDNRIVADLCASDPRIAAVLHEARNLTATYRGYRDGVES